MPDYPVNDLNAPDDDGWGSDEELRSFERLLAQPLPGDDLAIDPLTPSSDGDEDDSEDDALEAFTPFTVFQRARSIFIAAMEYMTGPLDRFRGRVIPLNRSFPIATIEEDVHRLGQLLLSLAEQHDFLDLQLALVALMGAITRLQQDLDVLLESHSVQRPPGPGESEWRDMLRSMMLSYLRNECFGSA